MNAHGVDPRTYVPQDKLYVWALVDPSNPTLVGEVGLSLAQLEASIDRDALKI